MNLAAPRAATRRQIAVSRAATRRQIAVPGAATRRQIAVPRAATRRRAETLDLLRETGRVTVDDLARHFVVTPQTIRRDPNDLADAQMLVRVHGGAMVASDVVNLAYEARAHRRTHKRLIGEAAARLVPDHSSIFLTIGTTTEEVARTLGGHAGLLVITNNLQVAAELYRNTSIEVVVTGGSVRHSDGGIVGMPSEALIAQFRVDLAVIGTSANDPDGTLLDFDIREVQPQRAIIEHARKVMLVAESSKFARSVPALVAHLADVDVLVTETACPRRRESFAGSTACGWSRQADQWTWRTAERIAER